MKSIKAGPIGRAGRLLVGAYLMFVSLPIYFRVGWEFVGKTFLVLVALTAFYIVLHVVITKYVGNINRWLGAVVAVMPVFLVWLFGQGGGGLILGRGEGGLAALSYIGLSLLIDVVRSDAGCEVMAIPGLLLRNRTHLVCIAFSPIDAFEQSRRSRRSVPN